MNHSARIMILGKGFSVTRESEEFQLLVPNDPSQLSGELEQSLRDFADWSGVIEPFYSLTSREAGKHKCLLITATECSLAVVTPTKDRFNRPSVLVAISSIQIDWDNVGLHEVFSRCCALASRLGESYSTELFNNPVQIQQQLHAGTFVSDRLFQLKYEEPDTSVEWLSLLNAIKELKGITGVSTAPLAALGANVLLGTEHEMNQAMSGGLALDGYFHAGSKKIVAVGPRLQPFDVRLSVQVPERSEEVTVSTPETLKQLTRHIEAIDKKSEERYVAIEKKLDDSHSGLVKTIEREMEGVFRKLKKYLRKHLGW